MNQCNLWQWLNSYSKVWFHHRSLSLCSIAAALSQAAQRCEWSHPNTRAHLTPKCVPALANGLLSLPKLMPIKSFSGVGELKIAIAAAYCNRSNNVWPRNSSKLKGKFSETGHQRLVILFLFVVKWHKTLCHWLIQSGNQQNQILLKYWKAFPSAPKMRIFLEYSRKQRLVYIFSLFIEAVFKEIPLAKLKEQCTHQCCCKDSNSAAAPNANQMLVCSSKDFLSSSQHICRLHHNSNSTFFCYWCVLQAGWRHVILMVCHETIFTSKHPLSVLCNFTPEDQNFHFQTSASSSTMAAPGPHANLAMTNNTSLLSKGHKNLGWRMKHYILHRPWSSVTNSTWYLGSQLNTNSPISQTSY